MKAFDEIGQAIEFLRREYAKEHGGDGTPYPDSGAIKHSTASYPSVTECLGGVSRPLGSCSGAGNMSHLSYIAQSMGETGFKPLRDPCLSVTRLDPDEFYQILEVSDGFCGIKDIQL